MPLFLAVGIMRCLLPEPGEKGKKKSLFFQGEMCTINISLHIWNNIKHLHPGDSSGHKSWKGHKELLKDLVTAFIKEYYPILKICGNKRCGSTAGVSFTQETNFPDKNQKAGADAWPVPIRSGCSILSELDKLWKSCW